MHESPTGICCGKPVWSELWLEGEKFRAVPCGQASLPDNNMRRRLKLMVCLVKCL